MNRISTLLGLAAIALGATTANAQSFTDTFDGGANSAGWTFGAGNDTVEMAGGNPGAYVHDTLNFFNTPEVKSTNATNNFVGDLRGRGVSSMGIDLVVNTTVFNSFRDVSLMLTDGNHVIWLVNGDITPAPGAGWKSFDFAFDSASTTMPAGWNTFSANPDAAWDAVMTNVTETKFFWGDPNFFYGGENWDIGFDNVRVVASTGSTYCFGDGSGATCPCGNLGAAGEGCLNSSGSGALLDATGSASVSNDTLSFSSTQLPANKSSLLFTGVLELPATQILGDGLLCTGGLLTRLGVVNSSATGEANWGGGLIGTYGWNAGETRYFQVWYRDTATSPCAQAFNTSNGYAIQIEN